MEHHGLGNKRFLSIVFSKNCSGMSTTGQAAKIDVNVILTNFVFQPNYWKKTGKR